MELIPIRDHFDLQISLLRLERQHSQLETALRQAKHDLQEAKMAQTEYGSTFKSFLDKFTGKRESTESNLRHGVQRAEANLASTQQEYDTLATQLSQLRAQISALPDWASRNDGSREWYRLDALYCTEMMPPLLDITHHLLLERRAQFNSTHAGEIKTRLELADIYSAPETAGEDCRSTLLRLKEALDRLEIPFEMGSYFDAPTAFLSSATKFTRMDRINSAIGQTEKLRKQLPDLQKQLED